MGNYVIPKKKKMNVCNTLMVSINFRKIHKFSYYSYIEIPAKKGGNLEKPAISMSEQEEIVMPFICKTSAHF